MAELVATRVVDTPVERAWKAWTHPDHLTRWWGPVGWTFPVARLDVREGGTSLVCLRSPSGRALYSTWTYRRVVPNERIEFILGWADDSSDLADPVAVHQLSNAPHYVCHVVSFRSVGADRTEMTVTQYDWSMGHVMGVPELGIADGLDRMAASLEPAFVKDRVLIGVAPASR